MSTPSSKLIWADITRIVAMLLVVAVHTTKLPTHQTLEAYAIASWFTLGKTGVPLFLMLSGALLLPKKENLALFFAKRVRRVVLPWGFWAGVATVPYILSGQYEIWQLFTLLPRMFISEFTFLPVLFGVYALLPLLRVLVHNSPKTMWWYAAALWFLGISVLPHTQNSLAFPLSVDTGLAREVISFIGYPLLGHIIATCELKKHRWALSSVALTILVGIVFSGVGSNKILTYSSYTSPVLIVISATIFAVLSSLENTLRKVLTSKPHTSQIITTLSQASFGVFLLHPLILKLNVLAIPDATISSTIVRFSVLSALSFGALIGLQRIPKLRKLVG